MNYDRIYFLGIGGIGMSNLARYFLTQGFLVAGYDRAKTDLTTSLEKEGANIHYKDDLSLIPVEFKDKSKTLIVYTPAIPVNHSEFIWFSEQNFQIMKRAQVLGQLTKGSDAICVAGTHGKTTVSSMIAHLLRQSTVDCNAFLGGILKNYNTNILLSDKSNITVIEADEYDRSFHWLSPWIAIITSTDPDHLDIYGTEEAYRESFEHFTSLVRNDGYLIMKYNAPLPLKTKEGVKVYTYSEKCGDFHAENIRVGNGEIIFNFVSKDVIIEDIYLGVPIRINIENVIAAIASTLICGITPEEIKKGVQSFGGSRRRFDFLIKSKNITLIDDYAHHPRELSASINSIKELFDGRKVTGIFQPHLYSRTRDFADDFAESLSLLDDIILLDIYPAREEPIEGVTSDLIFKNIKSKEKVLIGKSNLISYLENKDLEVVVTLGAGDISELLPELQEMLRRRYSISI